MTSSPVVITGFTPPDSARWIELWSADLAFHEISLPAKVFDHTWRRVLQGVALHGLAARLDGTIMGIAHFLFHSSAGTLTPVCYLQDLFVDGALRGRGAGRMLIEAVAARARDSGSTRFYWLTQDHNAAARRLYDRVAKHSGYIRYDYPLS